MSLNPREQAARQFMEERFIPVLHALLEAADQHKYTMYGGNACRQTAILGMHFLEQLLPEYKWRAWEGVFDDIIDGKPRQYDHAWLYGVGPGRRRLLVDLARKVQERLFMVVPANNYPKDHPEYIHMTERKRTKIDVEQRLHEPEWYTRRLGSELLPVLEELTQFQQWLHEHKEEPTMIDKAVQEIRTMAQDAILRAEEGCDEAVRVLDNVAPMDDFVRLRAMNEAATHSELWLTRALSYIVALELLGHPDTLSKAKATATHQALKEVWVERSRLSDRILAEREGRAR